jgi:N-acetylglucosamine-6-phosphate deacetylase
VTSSQRPASGSLRLAGGRAWDTGQPVDVTVAGGLIARIAEPGDPEPVGPGPVLDCSGLLVAPGLIDLQVNGAYGHDITGDPEAIWEVASRLPAWGVTAFLPTVISSGPEVVASAREVLRRGPPAGWEGAVPLGLHCEGPMISPRRRGTHPRSLLAGASLELVERWGGLDRVKMVTLAPELPGAARVTRHLVAAGVVVAAGHSDADFATATASFGWGISCGTHLFNAMSGLDHRQPGLAAALLATPGVVAGLIADGVHVHPGMVAAAWRAKGPSGLAVVSDAMAAAGLGDGAFTLGVVPVSVDGYRAVNGEGHLAGSVVPLDQAVRNLRRFAGCPVAAAIGAASATPARVLGDASRGGLAPGMRADLTLLDEALVVRATLVGGRVAFDRSASRP